MVKAIFCYLFNMAANVGHMVKYGIIQNFLLSVLPEELSAFVLLLLSFFEIY